MRLFTILLFTALAGASAQNDPAKPPDPKRKARELLDASAEMVGGARPDVGASALVHIGDNYQAIDRKKALEFLKQAFTVAGAIPPENESSFQYRTQEEAIRTVSTIDVAESVAMLKQMQAPRSGYDMRISAGTYVVGALVQKEQYDTALELIESMGSLGVNLFHGAGVLFGKLPQDDPRRLRLWSRALAAFNAKPNQAFTAMLAQHWKELPGNMAETSLRAVLNAVLDNKTGDFSQQYQPKTIAASRGIVSLPSQQDSELFDIMCVVKEIDPKRVDEILQTRPELKAALQRFPLGKRSMYGAGETYTSYTTMSNNKSSAQQGAAEFQRAALNQSRAEESVAALRKGDADKALDLVASIPDASKQAEILGLIARSVGEKDPARARSVLNKCIALLDKNQRPADVVAPWDAVSEVAHQIKDDQLLRLALDRMLAVAAALYRYDTRTDRTNRAWRDYWPSTMAYRRAIRRAALCYGVEAETLLFKITDIDIHLMARIELAQALLGRPHTDWRTYGGMRPMNPIEQTGAATSQ